MAPTEPAGLPIASAGQLRSARRLRQRKQRERLGRFLVEGPQAVRECVTTAAQLLVTAQAAARHADIISAAQQAGVPVHLTDQLDQLSDSVTPQGIVAIHDTVEKGLDEVITEQSKLVVIAAQIRDPGNLGTVIRCADAFGAAGVVVTAGSVDLHNPKTVRASVGSLFHLPISTGAELAAVTAACHRTGMTILAADGTGETQLDQLATTGRLARPTAWLFGNEAWGLPEPDLALADQVVRVPMWGAAESLNLATAAAVCLYTTAAAHNRGSETPIQ